MYIVTYKDNNPMKVKIIKDGKEDTISLTSIGQTFTVDELTDKLNYLESKGIVSSTLIEPSSEGVNPEPEVVDQKEVVSEEVIKEDALSIEESTEEVKNESEEENSNTENTYTSRRKRRSHNKEENESKEES